MPILEPMADFFAARVETYDEHMINNVEGCKEGYIKLSELIPEGTVSLLDLGCGTGLELDYIFPKFPNIQVTGIDLSEAMLAKLKKKHGAKLTELICGDYFTTSFGTNRFDTAVSFESLHHFPAEKKLGLYKKLYAALKVNGVYIECDYMVETPEEESYLMTENLRLRKEQGIPTDAFYHYDTPLTVEKQISLLKKAGFQKIEKIFRIGGTVMLTATK